MLDLITEPISAYINTYTGISQAGIKSFLDLVLLVALLFFSLRLVENLLLRYIKTRNDSKDQEAKLNTITKMLDGFFKFLTVFFITIQILLAFNVDKAQIIAILGTLSVAIGFAAQGIMKDLINGVVFVVEDQYKLGDFIEVNKTYKGVVEKLTMRVTQLRDVDGALHILPNSSILEVTTFAKEYTKAIIIIGIEYSADIDFVVKKLEEEMEEAYKDLGKKLLAKPEILGISAFQDSCIDLKIVCDTAVGEKVGVEYNLRLRIKKMFDREGIVIPFPQCDVNLVK